MPALGGAELGRPDAEQKPSSEAIPAEQRSAVLEASAALGNRITTSDVAAKSGLSLPDTERALQAIAMDAGGSLEVSDTGELVYVLPNDAGARLAAKSTAIRLEPAIKKAQQVAGYVSRVSFGTALLVSIAVVYAAIYLAYQATQDRERESRSSFGGYYGGGMYMNPYSMFWYWDPYYYERRRYEREVYGETQEMNFFEAVFSFVFGDGDPNMYAEGRRWELVGQVLRANGGVVTAEQLAPYLDLTANGRSPLVLEGASDGRVETTVVDESFVLEVLQRFDGAPEVDDNGNIYYSFPKLRTTAGGGGSAGSMAEEPAFLLRNWKFSEAGRGQLLMAGLLGVVNLVGVVILGNMLGNPQVLARIVYAYGNKSGTIAFIKGVAAAYPFLVGYAALFFLIPLIRSFWVARRNAAIDAQNEARLEALEGMRRAGPVTQAKLRGASDRAKSAGMDVLGRDRIVYDSGEGNK